MRVARVRKSDWVCVNIELWNSLPAETGEFLFLDCSNYPNADIGNIYDPNTNTFSEPTPEPEPVVIDPELDGEARTSRIKKKLVSYGMYDESMVTTVGRRTV